VQIKPLGTYVLIEVDEVKRTSTGGIVLPEDLIKKEQAVTQFGFVRAFGPTCYVGWAGCDQKDKTPAECWGVKIGDRVEFQKYEGKACMVPGYETFRYIPDTHIIGVIADE
jgi:co-chaperonin GroES (HSP10)